MSVSYRTVTYPGNQQQFVLMRYGLTDDVSAADLLDGAGTLVAAIAQPSARTRPAWNEEAFRADVRQLVQEYNNHHKFHGLRVQRIAWRVDGQPGEAEDVP